MQVSLQNIIRYSSQIWYVTVYIVCIMAKSAFPRTGYENWLLINPTRGEHGSVMPQKNKILLLVIFLKMCGAAFMTSWNL